MPGSFYRFAPAKRAAVQEKRGPPTRRLPRWGGPLSVIRNVHTQENRFRPGVAAPGPGGGNPSDCLRPALAGADPDAIVEWKNEDLAVADLTVAATASGLDDR